MRFSWAVAVVVLGMSVIGLAQQSGSTFKVKKSPPEKAPKSSMPVGKTPKVTSSSTANAKDLQNLERQTAKATAPHREATVKKTPANAGALKPVKDKPNPPINFSGTSGAKGPAKSGQGSNPYKGRLRQKHTHQ